MMMSASFFSTLPPELICQVFKSTDDFSVVSALAQTARIFYYIWRENPISICRAIAPRVIANFADAERLVGMEEEAKAVRQSPGGGEQNSINRAKRLLINARCASAAISNWVDFCQIHEVDPYYRGENPHMRPSELARFEHAFYCVWNIGVMGGTPQLKEKASTFLDQCSPQELFSLYELSLWARSYNDNNFGSSGLNFKDEVWKTGCDIVSKRYDAYRIAKPLCAGPENDIVPCGFFAFFDHTQRYLDLMDEEE
jgi:hypothetical protein